MALISLVGRFGLSAAIGVFFCATATAASPQAISGAAVQQIAALNGIKTSKTSAQRKIDSRLYLAMLHERNDARLASLATFRFIKAEADGRVPVDIVITSAAESKTVMNALEKLQANVISKNDTFLTAYARVRLSDLETLAALPEIRAIRQHMPALTQKINTSQGDTTHGAHTARDFFGTTGSSVKVCVMSNGVNSLATMEASGDLPSAVDVLPGQEGHGDEGTAMLEIVHDLAPGAALGFAQSGPDEAGFAQNILGLAISGCNVIVDDALYFDESPFEDGPVAQAVNTVTTNGVLFFSSAGNEGNKDDQTSGTWEGDFRANGTLPATGSTSPVHDFGDGGKSILVTAGGGTNTPLILIWAEHYDLSIGNASTDYDLYVMNGDLTSVNDASTNTQDGSGGDDYPVEFINSGASTGDRLVITKVSAGATAPPMFNLILFRGQLDPSLATAGATRGHSAAAAAFSVAATPAAEAFEPGSPIGPFPNLFSASDVSELFSSDGPRRLLLDGTTGAELTANNRSSTGGIVRQKPDITAADGVSVATPSFNPFFGTSAAAPHAAAIAALLKSALPNLTPAQVRTNLVGSTIDIEAAGVDRDTGFGIVMPYAALTLAGAQPRPTLTQGAPVYTEVTGDGDAFIETFETFDISVPIANSGGASATSVSATLTTSTPGILITAAQSTYPDLTIGATASNTSPFTFTVQSTAACGGFANFTLTLDFNGAVAPQTFQFSTRLGSAGTPVVTSYSGPAVAIPDSTGSSPGVVAAATLPVSVPGNVYAMTMSIDGSVCSTASGSTTVGIDHTYVSDLAISLVAPSGKSALVINHTDSSGNNFCKTILDDTAATSIQAVTSADAPFSGTYKPYAPLATFIGEAASGAWMLQAQDSFISDTGHIRAFSVSITPAICNAPPDGIFADDFD